MPFAATPVEHRLAKRLTQIGDCFVWTGAKRPGGYGVIGGSSGGRNYYDSPHRIVFRATKGAIPTGLQLDHLCRVRACVHPGHLEAVTQAENIRRENAMRWHGQVHHGPPGDQWVTCTLRDLVALLAGARPVDEVAA